MNHDDRDVLRRMMEITIITLRDIPPEQIREVERRIRAEFGGEEVYIARRSRVELSERDALIKAALDAGEPPDVVAREHGLSRRQMVRRVRGRNA